MSLKLIFIIKLALVASFITKVECSRKKKIVHEVILDPRIHPTANNGNGNIKITVRIGEFMDIVCPQYDPSDKNQAQFVLYRLNYADYNACNLKGQTSIFECKEPEKTVKLTTKFQKFSPNPLGFTFAPNNTYYYVATPPGKKTCDNGYVVEVSVLEKNHKHKLEPVAPDLVPVTVEPTMSTTTRTKFFKDTTKKTLAPTHQSASAVVGVAGGGANHVSAAAMLTIIPWLIMAWLQT